MYEHLKRRIKIQENEHWKFNFYLTCMAKNFSAKN